jgi:hypothetical protein
VNNRSHGPRVGPILSEQSLYDRTRRGPTGSSLSRRQRRRGAGSRSPLILFILVKQLLLFVFETRQVCPILVLVPQRKQASGKCMCLLKSFVSSAYHAFLFAHCTDSVQVSSLLENERLAPQETHWRPLANYRCSDSWNPQTPASDSL